MSVERKGRIERTAALVDQLQQESQRELEGRYTRRNRLRRLDELLQGFESLTNRGVREAPVALTHHVYRMAQAHGHPLLHRPIDGLSNEEWMAVVYDLQEPWLLPAEDRDDPD